MEYKTLGNTGERIPCVGMGTWELQHTEKSLTALKAGLAMGDRFIDTAELYGTEDIVGKAIAGEDGVFVASKVWVSHFRHDDVIRACTGSLKKLGLKQIDLYQLHWPSRDVPIKDTMSAMEALLKQGKIRHIGVSNFSVAQLREARDALKGADVVSNQVEYGILMREPEHDGMLEYCAKERITVIAYSPLSHGALFGPGCKELMQTLESVGHGYGKTGAQVALSWLVSHDQVVPIPKASSAEHVKANIAAAELKLSKKDIGLLDRESLRFARPSLASSRNW